MKKLVFGTILAGGLLIAAPALAMTSPPSSDHPARPGKGSSSSEGGTQVPEPGTLGLMGLGLAGLAFASTRKRRRS